MVGPLRPHHWALGLLASALLHGGAVLFGLPESGLPSGAGGEGAEGPLQLRLVSTTRATPNAQESTVPATAIVQPVASPASAVPMEAGTERATPSESHAKAVVESRVDPAAAVERVLQLSAVASAAAAVAESSEAPARDLREQAAHEPLASERVELPLAASTLPSVSAALISGSETGSAGSRSDGAAGSARGAGESAEARYLDGIAGRVHAALRYPRRARRSGAGVAGNALVAVRIDRAGQLVWCEIAQTSGSLLLDRDACMTVERAAPFGPGPASLSEHDLEFTIPVEYELLRR